MSSVPGTKGYSDVIDRFIEATDAVDFFELHRAYVDLIPREPGRVLDLGAGTGRDASVFASMGHHVCAVEPMAEFRAAGARLHASPRICWTDDSLPRLGSLVDVPAQFDFVLASGVWHHIDEAERRVAMARIFDLMKPGAVFALSLRNGPAGGGTHVFPTDAGQTAAMGTSLGFELVARLADQPSLIKGKKDVRWSYLVFRRDGGRCGTMG